MSTIDEASQKRHDLNRVRDLQAAQRLLNRALLACDPRESAAVPTLIGRVFLRLAREIEAIFDCYGLKYVRFDPDKLKKNKEIIH